MRVKDVTPAELKDALERLGWSEEPDDDSPENWLLWHPKRRDPISVPKGVGFVDDALLDLAHRREPRLRL